MPNEIIDYHDLPYSEKLVHQFIDSMLSDSEIESIALSGVHGDNIVTALLYYAVQKRNEVTEALIQLKALVSGDLVIVRMLDGRPILLSVPM